jgi:hypothetical protein
VKKFTRLPIFGLICSAGLLPDYAHLNAEQPTWEESQQQSAKNPTSCANLFLSGKRAEKHSNSQSKFL